MLNTGAWKLDEIWARDVRQEVWRSAARLNVRNSLNLWGSLPRQSQQQESFFSLSAGAHKKPCWRHSCKVLQRKDVSLSICSLPITAGETIQWRQPFVSESFAVFYFCSWNKLRYTVQQITAEISLPRELSPMHSICYCGHNFNTVT